MAKRRKPPIAQPDTARAQISGERNLTGLLTLVFTALTIVASIAAWLVYPIVTSPQRTGPIATWVNSSREIQQIELDAQGQASGGTVDVTVYATGRMGDGGELQPMITIYVTQEPKELIACTKPAICVAQNNFPGTENPTDPDSVSSMLTASPTWAAATKDGALVATMSIHMKGPSVGMSCNEWSCQATAPLILVDPNVKVAADAFGIAQLSYPGLQKYNWTGDYLHAQTLSNPLVLQMPIGIDTSLFAATRHPLDGEDPTASQSATARTFIAGALIGLAGGTFVAALEGAIRWGANRPRRKPPNTPTR